MQREMVHEQGNGTHHHPHQQLPRFGNGNGNGAATGVARASKKNKIKKIPQRGLGVAQLEKLRIEEQKKMEGAATAMSVPSAAHLGGGGLGHLLPMHPPPPPPPLSLSAALPRPAADCGVHCGYPPMLWDSSLADPTTYPHKRSLCPQPPLPTVSTGLSLTASSSHPTMHPTEPPSNQMYSCSSVSRTSAASPSPADEDREAAGVDRSWPFMFEGLNTTAFRTTMAKPPFAARTTPREVAGAGLPDVCPDLSRYEFRATNYFSSNASYSDCWASEFGHCKNSKENEAAYLTLNAQAATPRMKQLPTPAALPSIHLTEFGDFGVMQPQHGSGSSSSSRPFYSFMPVGPVRCERPLSEIKADTSDGVDLELKL